MGARSGVTGWVSEETTSGAMLQCSRCLSWVRDPDEPLLALGVDDCDWPKVLELPTVSVLLLMLSEQEKACEQ